MATSKTEQTQSVLDSMVAAFGAAKTGTAAKAGLTPVGVEPGGPLDRKTTAPFPYDDMQTTKTAIITALKGLADIRQELHHVEGGLIALGAAFGIVPSIPGLVTQKIEPRYAGTDPVADSTVEGGEDPDFAEAFAAKAAAAQAAVFADAPPAPKFNPLVDPKPTDAEGPGWTCPVHDETPKQLISRKKRHYRACSVEGCPEFEKEGDAQ